MITKEAKDIYNNIYSIFFTKSARSAFLHVLNFIKTYDKRPILLPAYIGMNDYEGSGIFDVVSISRLNYDFYPLDIFLNPDINDLESKIKSKNYSSLLLVHYFGFPTIHFDKIISLCKENKVLLIEDCAHTLGSKYNGIPLGNFGDFAFYSIHKNIATVDGGILKINSKRKDFPKIESLKEGLNVETLHQYLKTDITLCNEIRRKNYLLYLKELPVSNNFKVLYETLDEGTVPLNFPVYINHGLREKVYFSLLKDGVVTTALYYKLIPQIDKTTFIHAQQLSENILNLPLHQDIKAYEINTICDKFNKIINHFE